MPDRPSKNVIAQNLELLMSGRGFNFYDNKNQARADDLLVRQRASGFLTDASQALTDLEAAYRGQYIPASTREQPYPPAEAMAKLKGIGQLRSKVSDIETQIRGMSVPTQDKVWWRFRDEAVLLEQLVGFDYQLISQCRDIADQVRAVTADDWNAGTVTAGVNAKLTQLQTSIRERQQFLAIQVV